MKEFDAIVVGAGPSGSEAAWALGKRGLLVGLATDSLDSVYRLETAPAGEPPANSLLELAWSPDPWTLHRQAKYALEAEPNVHLFQSSVTALLADSGQITGVRTWEGLEYRAGVVVLAVGSFLGARLQVGELEEEAGRWGEVAYPDLYQHLRSRGFSFEEAGYAVPQTPTTPAYTVRFQKLADWDPQTGRLPLAGLYAAGRVVLGHKTPLERALSGRQLGERLGS